MSPRKKGKSVPAQGPGLRPKIPKGWRRLRRGTISKARDRFWWSTLKCWMDTAGVGLKIEGRRANLVHIRRIQTSGSESAEGRSKSKSPRTRNTRVTQGRSGRAEG
jgi:hypothetical protein